MNPNDIQSKRKDTMALIEMHQECIRQLKEDIKKHEDEIARLQEQFKRKSF